MRSAGVETVLIGGVAHRDLLTMGVDVRVRSMDDVGLTLLGSSVLDVALFLDLDAVARLVSVLEATVMSVEGLAVDNRDVLVLHGMVVVLVLDGKGNGQQGGQCDELDGKICRRNYRKHFTQRHFHNAKHSQVSFLQLGLEIRRNDTNLFVKSKLILFRSAALLFIPREKLHPPPPPTHSESHLGAESENPKLPRGLTHPQAPPYLAPQATVFPNVTHFFSATPVSAHIMLRGPPANRHLRPSPSSENEKKKIAKHLATFQIIISDFCYSPPTRSNSTKTDGRPRAGHLRAAYSTVNLRDRAVLGQETNAAPHTDGCVCNSVESCIFARCLGVSASGNQKRQPQSSAGRRAFCNVQWSVSRHG